MFGFSLPDQWNCLVTLLTLYSNFPLRCRGFRYKITVTHLTLLCHLCGKQDSNLALLMADPITGILKSYSNLESGCITHLKKQFTDFIFSNNKEIQTFVKIEMAEEVVATLL